MNDSFWTGGKKAYARGLREQMEAEIRPLREQLHTESDPRLREEIERRIKEIEKNHAQKTKQSGRGLFFK